MRFKILKEAACRPQEDRKVLQGVPAVGADCSKLHLVCFCRRNPKIKLPDRIKQGGTEGAGGTRRRFARQQTINVMELMKNKQMKQVIRTVPHMSWS